MKTLKRTLVLALVFAVLTASMIFITACGAQIDSIEITAAPTVIEYQEGELFNTAGMIVTAKYSDGTTSEVSGYTVSAVSALTTSDTTVTVTYEGKTATQEITVNAVKMTMLALAKNSEKISYKSSETFNDKGMKVMAVYDDGTTEEVSDYTVYPESRNLNVNDTSVIISYGGMSVEQPIVVTADNTSPTNSPIVYKVVGAADLGGQNANINFEFRDNGIVTGKLESGQGAAADDAISALINFPGTWEKSDSAFTVKFNDFTFDPSKISGLIGMIPPDMMTPEIQDMIDTLMEMDPIEIKGCLTTAALSAEELSFTANFEAMGIALTMECSGTMPEDISFAAGEKIDAEFGDISGMQMKSGSPIAYYAKGNRTYVVGGSVNENSVLKMNIDSATAVQDVKLAINASASKKGVDVNTYFALKVNGEEVKMSGELASVVNYVDLAATVDLLAGANTVELIWKQAVSVKVDYVTLSTDVTLVSPTYGLV